MYFKRREKNLKYTFDVRWFDNHYFPNRSILNGIFSLWDGDRYTISVERAGISPRIDEIMEERGYIRFYELPDRIVFVRNHTNDDGDDGADTRW